MKKTIAITFHVFLWLLGFHLIFNLVGVWHSFVDFLEGDSKLIDEALIFIPTLLVVYYINYLVLTPQFLDKENWKKYLLFTLILVVIAELLVGALFDYWSSKGFVMRVEGFDVYIYLLQFVILSITIGSSISLFDRMVFNAEKRNLAEKKQKEAELKFLNAQVNPHFIFNTLNSIYSIALAEDAKKTTEAVLKLSEIMRHPLNEGLQDFVELKQEIDFLRNYIELHQIRFGEKVPIDFQIIGDNAGLKIAPLLLISLVENAFKYGVSHRSPEMINIRLEVKNKQLFFFVSNRIYLTQNTSSHQVGLQNLKSRLELIYPDQYSLEFTHAGNRFNVHLMLSMI